MRRTLFAAALLLGAPLVLAQDDGPYTLTKVTPDITMISGNGVFTGGNITLLTGKDYRVLIDDGLNSYATQLLDTVAKLAGGPIDFVINTHVLSPRFCRRHARRHPFADEGRFQFRHRPDNGEHRLAHRTVRVHLVLHADEPDTEVIEFLQGG